jgi:hypothetical protein
LLAVGFAPGGQRDDPAMQLLATLAEVIRSLWFGPATQPSSEIEI